MKFDIFVTILISLMIHAAIIGFVDPPESRLEMLALPRGGLTLQVYVTLSKPQKPGLEFSVDVDQPSLPSVKLPNPPEPVIKIRGKSHRQTLVKVKKKWPEPARKPERPQLEPVTPAQPPAVKEVAKVSIPDPAHNQRINGTTAQRVARTDDIAGLTDQRPLVSEPLFNGPQRKPTYPYLAQRRGQQGTVLMEVFLNNRGLIESVTLMDSSGFSLLDRAAEKAVRGWSFLPLVRDGVSTACRVRVPVIFKLDA